MIRGGGGVKRNERLLQKHRLQRAHNTHIQLKEADLNFDCATFCALPSFGIVTTFSSHKVSMKGRSDMCSVIYLLFYHNTK